RGLHAPRRKHGAADKRRVDREVSLATAHGSGFEVPADSISPGAKVQQREQEQALLAALERLPATYRQMITWHHRDGVTFEEVGARLGSSAEAARKPWSRAP